LLGTDYTLLRKEFWSWQGWQRQIPEVAGKILVTLGGSDPDNVTLKVMKALQDLEVQALEAVVVVGGSNPHYQQLQDAANQSRFPIFLKQNATNMPELMAWADVAVAAGGSTNWELAFMGLPSIIITLADNQQDIACKLNQIGITLNLGWYEDQTPSQIAKVTSDLLLNWQQRYQMSQKGKQVVNGKGGKRVLEAMSLCYLK
jgi:spore coat polysaccharide biosynthesis predicted glycosyltransferase SpsG